MEPVVCYRCGANISAIWDAFQLAKQHYLITKKQANEQYIDNIQIYSEEDQDINEVFMMFNLPPKKQCCRMILQSVALINEY